MKHYHQPETQVLQVINNSIICASGGPGPVVFTPSGQLGTMSNGSVQLGTMSSTESSSF